MTLLTVRYTSATFGGTTEGTARLCNQRRTVGETLASFGFSSCLSSAGGTLHESSAGVPRLGHDGTESGIGGSRHPEKDGRSSVLRLRLSGAGSSPVFPNLLAHHHNVPPDTDATGKGAVIPRDRAS